MNTKGKPKNFESVFLSGFFVHQVFIHPLGNKTSMNELTK